ncbi:hypothetical protein CRUP_012063 [Coryphaenoides rupestris]|nr:hypothetical protein CRUP_012063 [Coryphaenoides rupestris]
MGGCVGRSQVDGQGSASRHSKKRGGGRNEPLRKEGPKWKTEQPLTEGQLRTKRDEFWDTAPAFDGRKEIWDALRSLTESYDELGNRYQLPAYALTPPVNLITETTCDRDAATLTENKAPPPLPKQEFQLRVRLSTGKDLRLTATMADSICQLKKQLEAQEKIDGSHQRWFFSGKLLTDKTRLQDTKIQKDFVVQVIVNPQPPAISG